ncbi:MAG: mechanosensitive ion channel family protein [bacterium]
MPILPSATAILSLLLVAAAGTLAAIAVWALFRGAAKLASRTKGGLDDELARRLAAPAAVAVGALTAQLAVSFVAVALDASVSAVLRQGLAILFLAAAAWGVVRAIRGVFDAATKRRPRLAPATRLGSRLVAVSLYALAGLTILSQLGISVTPILTGLGIAGIAVALALQDTLSNFFAGVWIQTGRPLQPGHFVRLEAQKLEGYVEQVGWRTTRLRTLAGTTIVIPNASLAQSIVTDHNIPAPDLSVTMKFRVGYEQDPAKVVQALTEEAQALMQDDPTPFAAGTAPFAQLADLGDDALVFAVTVRVTEYVKQFQVQDRLRLRVLNRFRRDAIRIPYPTRHNIQEPVDTPAHRYASGPGGFAAYDRPPRPPPMRQAPATVDPREAEAEQAKQDIAEAQADAAAPKE